MAMASKAGDHYPDSLSASIVRPWLDLMKRHEAKELGAQPNYYSQNPKLLLTNAHAHSFLVGTGKDVYSALIPSIEQARSELILITCFWAQSPTLDLLGNALKLLSARVVERGGPKVRVRIGFSSLSLFQKLFHPHSIRGKIYPPSTWTSRLGLPSAKELPGLDIKIKSIFILPFSVMHPKFIIVDRTRVWLPSCNVSWEAWFEGAIELSGEVTAQFMRFYHSFWFPEDAELMPISATHANASEPPLVGSVAHQAPAYSYVHLEPLTNVSIPVAFLPSPHHRNPCFSPFSKQHSVIAPATPLNAFVLTTMNHATSHIYIQTPNLTSPPVLTSILNALKRGVSVHILTSERLMILEQLVTGGTTTSRCIKKLIKRYKALPVAMESTNTRDTEAQHPQLGSLHITYYQPSYKAHDRGTIGSNEPVQSHLKLTIVDRKWVVLGSGNMDRASWFTSQELGVAFESSILAGEVRKIIDNAMKNRTRTEYSSA
jgi:phosphatidylserine/phosphatidylglycerophosphate/cardiolipin synthase-like enzyme